MPYKWIAFLTVAEELRKQRQVAQRLGTYIGEKTFSLMEMQSYVTGYKGLYEKRTKRIPSLEMIEQIDKYLKCSISEKNQLRTSIGYKALESDPEGENLRGIINLLRKTLKYIPFPAYIVSREWDIFAFNAYMLKFIGMSEVEVRNVPNEYWNVLQFIFNPELPMKKHLTGGKGGWRAIAERNLYGYYKVNERYLHSHKIEDVFMNLLKVNEVEFQEIKKEVERKYHSMDPFYESDYVTEMEFIYDPEIIVRFRSLHIHHGDLEFPSIVAYIPVNDESIIAFNQLDLPIFEKQEIFSAKSIINR